MGVPEGSVLRSVLWSVLHNSQNNSTLPGSNCWTAIVIKTDNKNELISRANDSLKIIRSWMNNYLELALVKIEAISISGKRAPDYIKFNLNTEIINSLQRNMFLRVASVYKTTSIYNRRQGGANGKNTLNWNGINSRVEMNKTVNTRYYKVAQLRAQKSNFSPEHIIIHRPWWWR